MTGKRHVEFFGGPWDGKKAELETLVDGTLKPFILKSPAKSIAQLADEEIDASAPVRLVRDVYLEVKPRSGVMTYAGQEADE